MGKRVILTLIPGSFEHGFPVILRIESEGTTAQREIQVIGQLPPAPQILQLFKHWQSAYRQIVMPHSRIKPRPAQVTNVSCYQLGSQLALELNNWLNSGSREWQKIRDRLQHNLSQTDEILVLIETDDMQLRQLPWHLWDLFSEQYTKAEIALSLPEYQPLRVTTASYKEQVKILAILGDSTGIDVRQDRAVLEQLPHAETTFLVEPQRQWLNSHLWEQQWDILFFAGHSSSQLDGNTGQIYINQSDSLSLTELKNGLRRAIEQGLQLAIFNSCDGLGLARELADLQIPQIVVMREPVPDLVAQESLQYFLKAFASGKSLHLAVREARERLQGLEERFPCATWLPVICQNPASVPPTWQELCSQIERDSAQGRAKQQSSPFLPRASRFKTVLLASTVVAALVMGLRFLGILQSQELQAFDQLMQLRSSEGPDRRLLIVTIAEDDFKLPQQQNRKGSLSEQALALLLQKLEQFKPRAIGLDIYRDFPVDPKEADLASQMRHSDRLIAICRVSEPEVNEPGVSPPPEIPLERQGFSDFVQDSDGVLRRHLIAMKPSSTSPCTTPYALSAQLAFRYLDALGISTKYTQNKELQIGKVVFKRLRSHMGGYQQVDDWGYQILLNYRSNNSRLEFADRVTLKDVLTNKLKPEAVKNRIVLIGLTNESAGDFFSTPYNTGQQPHQKMPGVIVHAQMVSQILSAVLDGRPLLWVLPFWGEALWIWGWSVVGGILAWRVRHPMRLGLAGAATLGVLYGLSFNLLTQGCWVPLVPSALVLVFTGASVLAYNVFQASDSSISLPSRGSVKEL